MAGFDYEFAFTDKQASLVKVAMAAQRRRARNLDLTMMTKPTSSTGVYVRIDGSSRRMDILGYRLERELPLVCEGDVSSELAPKIRRRFGLGIADMYLRGRDTSRDWDKPMVLRGVADTRYYYPVFEFSPDKGASEQVRHRLRLTEELIADWDVRNISHFTVIEELHAASELLLQAVVPLPRGKDMYPQRLKAARKHGVLEERDVELLRALSRHRNDARHHAVSGFEAWLESNWENVALLLEHIAARVPPLPPEIDD